MKKHVAVAFVVLVILVISGLMYALNGPKPRPVASLKPPVQLAQKSTPAPKAETQSPTKEVKPSSFASASSYDGLAADNGKIKPAIPAYTVKADLSNVQNLKLFKKLFDHKMTSLLTKNSFVVTPTDYTQMFYVYENNEYQRPEKIPSFITSDSMLHTYHVFYDYTLREVESGKLYDAAVKLTNIMLEASKKQRSQASGAELKDAAARNVAFFTVGQALFVGVSNNPMANEDLMRIARHTGFAKSAVTGEKMDFSQFVPRGHYTRSEKLKKYFMAMMWYGLSPFPANKPGPNLQAILMTKALQTATAGSTSALKLWDMIYEPTAFYVGTADDYTYNQYSKILEKVYGKNANANQFAEQSKLSQFNAEVKKLPAPGIDNGAGTGGPQFRFMGQRFIPDSRIMRQMTADLVTGRGIPRGLDIFAAMGSDRALSHLKSYYKVERFPNYDVQMAKMRKEMTETPRSKWQSNLYYGWLWSLQSVVEPSPKGYPSFMTNDAWLDKSLFTALGSWTELRHDTILYAKQSVSECGGDSEAPPTPKGYVEPNLEFWTRLQWLNKYTKDGLNSRGLLNEEMKDKFTRMDDWLSFCRKITIKELTGKTVTKEEYDQICLYGAELESLVISFSGGDLLSDADKDMSLIADTHTDGSTNTCLEEATGRASAIYVVVPIQGKLYLTRGAVYTHYEFEWPASNRLSDEAWQKMLKSGKTPTLADWIKSFFTEPKKKLDNNFEAFSSGC
ncbi:MAG: DUF3160 domain-containing protein [Armatimonadota bacterium]